MDVCNITWMYVHDIDVMLFQYFVRKNVPYLILVETLKSRNKIRILCQGPYFLLFVKNKVVYFKLCFSTVLQFPLLMIHQT